MRRNLGCVIVTYNSADHIIECLDSLSVPEDTALSIAIVDNSSTDDTAFLARKWVTKSQLKVTIQQLPENLGFAAGVNKGLLQLLSDPSLDRFWILNPDCIVPPETPALLAGARKPFSIMGTRIIYANSRSQIQIDGGRINRWTGATHNVNIGRDPKCTRLPNIKNLDFISGASMVVSREFIEQAGLMPEQYFLYYEEVDWAQSRGSLPLKLCKDAFVYHQAGASIGSPTLARGPSNASAYFKHRARMIFMMKFYPARLPIAYLFGWAKMIQHVLRLQIRPIPATFRALHGLSAGRTSDNLTNRKA